MEGISEEDLKDFANPTHDSICKAAASWSDGVIIGSKEASSMASSLEVPTLEYQGDDYVEAYNHFYDEVLMEQEVLAEQ
jgi:tryptophan synthase alpha subunit